VVEPDQRLLVARRLNRQAHQTLNLLRHTHFLISYHLPRVVLDDRGTELHDVEKKIFLRIEVMKKRADANHRLFSNVVRIGKFIAAFSKFIDGGAYNTLSLLRLQTQKTLIDKSLHTAPRLIPDRLPHRPLSEDSMIIMPNTTTLTKK
jgi:hypothetical protein